MCGIAGLVAARGECIPVDWLKAAAGLLGHRGPDDQGFLLWDGVNAVEQCRELRKTFPTRVGFVHRRLSILDLSKGGWQPMSSPDGMTFIIFNGEIYNYLELRETLSALGRTFHSRSDTEVLLAGYAHWGNDVLERLTGMFAIALLDLRRRKLILARDQFGIKPLYYTETSTGIAFASEVEPLLHLPGMRRTCDPHSLYRYLQVGLCDHGVHTMFSEVRQLPAAHVLEIDLDEMTAVPQCYWTLPERGSADLDRKAATVHLRDLFIQSVRLHMRSDVPIGAALSGGIDSSAIVMAMRAIAGPQMDLHTFTYVAEGLAIDEERYANVIGAAARTTMHKVKLNAGKFLQDLDPLIKSQQLPFGSTSIYAQYCVFRKAHEAGIKVMLDGQGADEMLAGYISYLPARAASLARALHVQRALKLISSGKRSMGGGWSYYLPRLTAGMLPSSLVRAARSHLWAASRWLNLDWFRDRGVTPDSGSTLHASGSFDRALRTTFSDTSLPALLRYEDMNSMAHSIESRVPFLTPPLVNFLFSIPLDYLIDDNATTKRIFRDAMRGIVPDEILDRRDKIGFQTPERAWFGELEPLLHEILDSDRLVRLPFLNSAAIKSELSQSISTERKFDWRVWRWINIARWSEVFDVEYA